VCEPNDTEIVKR